jgi:hypothetical protein
MVTDAGSPTHRLWLGRVGSCQSSPWMHMKPCQWCRQLSCQRVVPACSLNCSGMLLLTWRSVQLSTLLRQMQYTIGRFHAECGLQYSTYVCMHRRAMCPRWAALSPGQAQGCAHVGLNWARDKGAWFGFCVVSAGAKCTPAAHIHAHAVGGNRGELLQCCC